MVRDSLGRAADVARALAAYRPKDPREGAIRPFERFLLHAIWLHDELVGGNGRRMITNPKAAEKVRGHLFRIEALIRCYRAVGSRKKLDKTLARVKSFEDALGGHGYAVDMLAGVRAARKAGRPVPARAVAHLERAARDARAVLVAAADDGWRPEKRGARTRVAGLDRVVDTFARIDFGTEREDATYVRGELARLCEKVARLDLDWDDLEAGVHEARRQLRWLPLTLVALDGLCVLDEKSRGPAAFAALRSDPVARSPFARLPVSGRDPHSFRLPWTLYLAVSRAIAELGAIKDRGQLILGLAGALVGSGEASRKKSVTAAEAILGDRGGLERCLEQGRACFDGVVDSGLLRALERAFRAA